MVVGVDSDHLCFCFVCVNVGWYIEVSELILDTSELSSTLSVCDLRYLVSWMLFYFMYSGDVGLCIVYASSVKIRVFVADVDL